MTSSLSLSIAAVVKELLLIAVSVVALHDVVSPVNVAGFGLTASGVLMFNLHKCAQRDKHGAPTAGGPGATPAPATLLTATRHYQRVPVSDAAGDASDADTSLGLVNVAPSSDEKRQRAASLPAAANAADDSGIADF